MSKEAKKYNVRMQKIFAVEMKGKSGKKIATYTELCEYSWGTSFV